MKEIKANAMTRDEMRQIKGSGLDACGAVVCCYYINPQNGTEQVSFNGQHTCCPNISGLQLIEMPHAC